MIKEDYLASVDIRSTGFTLAVTKAEDSNNPWNHKLLFIHQIKSAGIKRGLISSVDEVSEDFKNVILEAEKHIGFKIKRIHVSLSNLNVSGTHAAGVSAIKSQHINKNDIEKCFEASTHAIHNADHKVLHNIPVEFIVDNQREISDPSGMDGNRLEVKSFLVHCSNSIINNFDKVFKKAGIQKMSYLSQIYARSESILNSEQKELGSCVVDIGELFTQIIVYIGGKIQLLVNIPIGGGHITQDLAIGLRTTTDEAENIKKNYEKHVLAANRNEKIVVANINNNESHHVETTLIQQIIESRMEEIFSITKRKLIQSRCLEKLGGGFILCGSASKLYSIQALAEFILEAPITQPDKDLPFVLFDEEFSKEENLNCLSINNLILQRMSKQHGNIHKTSKKIWGNNKVSLWIEKFF